MRKFRETFRTWFALCIIAGRLAHSQQSISHGTSVHNSPVKRKNRSVIWLSRYKHLLSSLRTKSWPMGTTRTNMITASHKWLPDHHTTLCDTHTHNVKKERNGEGETDIRLVVTVPARQPNDLSLCYANLISEFNPGNRDKDRTGSQSCPLTSTCHVTCVHEYACICTHVH